MNKEQSTSSAIGQIIPIEEAQRIFDIGLTWLMENLLTIEIGAQVIAIMAALVPAALFGPRLQKFLNAQVVSRAPVGTLRTLAQSAAILAIPIALYICLSLLRVGFSAADLSTGWIAAALALMNAWIVVRLVTLVIKSPFWSRVAFFIAWPLAALDAFGALTPLIEQLHALAIPLGKDETGNAIKISLLDVIRTFIYFGLLFWAANIVSNLAQQQLQRIEELSPSLKALIGKLLNVILPIIALLIALQIVGFNLGTLAVFSGAIGLGIGLGLRGVVANFVAGFTLIADRSIKPNDTIEVDGTMGWVTSMQARYVALRTRDGTELLIPNDRFMTEGVINWSRSDKVIRQHTSFGVSYKAKDLRKIQSLAIAAATQVQRVVSEPAVVCNLEAFGDSSIKFSLQYWIGDPQNGLSNVRSDVLLKIWESLHENDIEIPFPQRDLHIKSWPNNLPAVPVEQI